MDKRIVGHRTRGCAAKRLVAIPGFGVVFSGHSLSLRAIYRPRDGYRDRPFRGQSVRVFKASFNRCRVVSTPSNRSPCFAILCSTTSIVNWAGSSPGFTSSQRRGVETGAPGRGLTEYAEAIVLPSPFWFASISTPRRLAFDHWVVASFGYERAIAPATISAKRRVSS